MRKVLAGILGLALCASAAAQSVAPAAAAQEHTLASVYVNGLLSAANQGGHVLPARGFAVSAVTMYLTVAASGTGNSVVTIGDGTNTCTATFTCGGDVSSSGGKRKATANAGGAGCVFPPSAVIVITTGAGCSVTQPTVKNVDVVGKWR